MHYDDKSKRVYLNGYLARNCHDVWLNVDSPTNSDMFKFKAEKIEIERLKDEGVYAYDYGAVSEQSPLEYLGGGLVFIAAIALLVGIIYLIYQAWWLFVGHWAFEGPFANETTAGEITFETILFFVAFIVIIEEVVRRIRNGHF